MRNSILGLSATIVRDLCSANVIVFNNLRFRLATRSKRNIFLSLPQDIFTTSYKNEVPSIVYVFIYSSFTFNGVSKSTCFRWKRSSFSWVLVWMEGENAPKYLSVSNENTLMWAGPNIIQKHSSTACGSLCFSPAQIRQILYVWHGKLNRADWLNKRAGKANCHAFLFRVLSSNSSNIAKNQIPQIAKYSRFLSVSYS